MLDLLLHTGDVQHVFGDPRQALGVLLHHVAQALLGRLVQVLGQQGIGLQDGGQGIADLMGHGGGHAAHGGHLFGAYARLDQPQVVQEDHAQPQMGGQQAFPGAVVLGLCRQHLRLQAGGQPGAHIQAHRALPFGQ